MCPPSGVLGPGNTPGFFEEFGIYGIVEREEVLGRRSIGMRIIAVEIVLPSRRTYVGTSEDGYAYRGLSLMDETQAVDAGQLILRLSKNFLNHYKR